MIEASSTTFLVDPLLVEDFGHTLRNRFMVYPPRRIDVGRMPPLHGVLITHEHEDHFDPRGLARLPRAVPVFLSARASIAAHRILAEMGFAVERVAPGQRVTRGDLVLDLFTPDHVQRPEVDEWAVLPFLARDRQGHGSLFSAVDYPPASGRARITRAEQAELLAGLADLAAHLYGGALFRALDSLDPGGLGSRRPTLALVLRMRNAGREDYLVLAYDPTSCAFLPEESADPPTDFATVFECWATDLLALFRGEMAPFQVVFGRCREWCGVPALQALSFMTQGLVTYFHPLRRPASYLSLFRRLLGHPPRASSGSGRPASTRSYQADRLRRQPRR